MLFQVFITDKSEPRLKESPVISLTTAIYLPVGVLFHARAFFGQGSCNSRLFRNKMRLETPNSPCYQGVHLQRPSPPVLSEQCAPALRRHSAEDGRDHLAL